MGCVNSTKKLNDLNNENVFRAVRLHSDLTDQGRNGYLEVTPRELIFRTSTNQRVVWGLQHLRRYGLNGDVFSFEAGRRCMTGQGIYTFRCQRAEQLYHLFQGYINAISVVAEEAFSFSDRVGEHPSHTLGRPENMQNTNNYLEPTPAVGNPTSILHRSRVLRESFSSGPLSLDSPASMPSLSFGTNEVVHFQSRLFPAGRDTHANTTDATANAAMTNSNVYSEYPLRGQIEHNNNLSNAFATLNRKTFVKHSSLDHPPEEFAPMLTPQTEAMHMYANVENGTLVAKHFGFAGIAGLRKFGGADAERCYENMNRENLNLILPSASSQAGRDANATNMSNDQQAKLAPTNSVNYIVLDLDQPRSPTQCSLKLHIGSGLSLATIDSTDGNACSKADTSSDALHSSGASACTTLTIATTTSTTTNTTKTTKPNSESVEQHGKNYSTIDFIKTCALIKSSTHGTDFNAQPGNEECRITRHSKCVRKAYSISE